MPEGKPTKIKKEDENVAFKSLHCSEKNGNTTHGYTYPGGGKGEKVSR